MHAAMSAPVPPAQPWYRHRWPWLLIAGPGIVVVAGFVTLWLAIASDDGLVADDYYKRGLAINRVLERTQRAAALGLSATVDVDAGGAARVTLVSPSRDAAATPTVLKLVIAHPTRAGHRPARRPGARTRRASTSAASRRSRPGAGSFPSKPTTGGCPWSRSRPTCATSG